MIEFYEVSTGFPIKTPWEAFGFQESQFFPNDKVVVLDLNFYWSDFIRCGEGLPVIPRKDFVDGLFNGRFAIK